MNKKLVLESKLRRLESLEGKGFFSRKFADDDEIEELKKDIKKIEDALLGADE